MISLGADERSTKSQEGTGSSRWCPDAVSFWLQSNTRSKLLTIHSFMGCSVSLSLSFGETHTSFIYSLIIFLDMEIYSQYTYTRAALFLLLHRAFFFPFVIHFAPAPRWFALRSCHFTRSFYSWKRMSKITVLLLLSIQEARHTHTGYQSCLPDGECILFHQKVSSSKRSISSPIPRLNSHPFSI